MDEDTQPPEEEAQQQQQRLTSSVLLDHHPSSRREGLRPSTFVDLTLRRESGRPLVLRNVGPALADLVRENKASLNALDFRPPDLTKVKEPDFECKNGHNVSACIVQAMGEAPANACDHCINGHGPFQICRVSRTIGKGACANCQWTGNANRCFWHQDKVGEPSSFTPPARAASAGSLHGLF
ncbi:hypothetical protein KEM52_003645 [Ascosphaera acerosa]|nr:hypothetical protein KEM52_003645 [Ascosphaera acerosa]